MFNYVADMFRAETADSEEEADRWYDDHTAGRRPPELLPRDEVARAINTEVKAGRGSPHGGVFLDIASRRSRRVHPAPPPLDVPPVHGARRRRHHHRADGGRPDLPLHHGRRPGRRRHRGDDGAGALRGRRGGGRDARLQPARRQLAVGPARLRPAGRASAPPDYVEGRADVAAARRRPRSTRRSARPSRRSTRDGGENPYDLHHDLQETMQARRHHPHRARAEEALSKLDDLEERAAKISVERRPRLQPRLEPGHRPAGHAHRLHAGRPRAPSNREESRGGHTREDYPDARPRDSARSTSSSAGQRAAGSTATRSRSGPEPHPRDAAGAQAELFEEGH